jgi:CubicO group peptidase (beta-lactamase class C family)
MRRILLILCLGLARSPLTVQGQATDPAEPLLRGLVNAINSADSATLARFVSANFVLQGPNVPSVDTRVELLLFFATNWGKLDIRQIEPRNGNALGALVRGDRTEVFRRVTIYMDSTSPKIRMLGTQRARDPDALTTRLTDAEVVAQLRAYLERLAARDVFSGTVLLAKGGTPLYSAAFGEANKDFGVRNTVETKFNLGSMNKMFTAVAVMQLVEAGKVSLEDTLGRFMPAGSMRPDVRSKVRVKHLLSHTSGLGSYFTDEWNRQSRALYRTVSDWIPLVSKETLAFEPGTRWSYSNTGMLLLGKVIEAASGKDYFDYIRERITGPTGMVNTDAYELDRVNRNLALGYDPVFRNGAREWQNNLFMHVIRGGPAGGGYSTVADLTRFATALKGGKLVSVAGFQTLTTAKPELGSPRYGFGFFVEPDPRIAQHSGGFPGINSQLDIYLDNDYTIAVMSNYTGGAEPVIEKARSLLGQVGSPGR